MKESLRRRDKKEIRRVRGGEGGGGGRGGEERMRKRRRGSGFRSFVKMKKRKNVKEKWKRIKTKAKDAIFSLS